MKFIKKILMAGCYVLYTVVSLFEAPFFLWKQRALFRNRIVYVFFHWSFGHTVAGIDYAARLYYPHRISLIYVPHPGSNPYLPSCFEHAIDPYTYTSILPSGAYGHADRQKYRVLRLYLLLISGLTERFQVIEFFNIYSTLSLAKDRLLGGNEQTGQLEKTTDYTGYIKLLRENIGIHPHLPEVLQETCRTAIQARFPTFFEKPYAVLLLRGKGFDAPWDSHYRCSGPQENYQPVVRYLTEEGFNVVGTGETRDDCFCDIPGYITLENLALPPKLLNLFMLLNCSLFIGQQSGPFVLLNSCRIPCLITDSVPYRLGTFNSDDLVLFKSFKNQADGRVMSLVEVFKNHLDLAWGYHFAEKNIQVETNSSDDLLGAVKETVLRMRGKLRYSEEDFLLCRQFKNLIPPEMPLFHHGNRPPLAILRKNKDELLAVKSDFAHTT